jgi:hypothetical protein
MTMYKPRGEQRQCSQHLLSRHSGALLLCRNYRVLQFRQRHHGELAGVFVEAWVEAALGSFSTAIVERAGHGIDSLRVMGAHLRAYLRTCAGLTPWNIGQRINTSCMSSRMSLASHLGTNITSCISTPPEFKVEPSTHLHLIPEVLGSNFCPKTDYPDRYFVIFLIPLRQMWGQYHKVGHCFL